MQASLRCCISRLMCSFCRFETLHRRCDGYFVSRSRFAASFCLHVSVFKRCSHCINIEYAGHFQNAEPFRHRIVINLLISLAAWCRFLTCTACSSDDCSAFVSHERYDPTRQAAVIKPARRTYRKFLCSGALFVCCGFPQSFAASLNSYPAAPISRRILHIQPFAVYPCSALRWIVMPAAFFSPVWCRAAAIILQKNNIFAAK